MSGKRIILCSLVIAWVSASNSRSSFFVAKQYTNNYFCVTNTSFALSWIQEPVKESLQQKSAYTPERNSSFHCDIKHNSPCTKNYFDRHPWSLQSGTDQIILDERWEEMEVVTTQFVNGKYVPLNFKPVLKLRTANVNNFNIPLSIRMKREGHIFLCDGESPSKSNCYWFMLQAFSGKTSAIRKCCEEKVPAENEIYPKISCKEQRNSTEHPAFPFYLSSSKWSHFILSKQDGVLTFSLYADHKLVKILEWHDPEAPIVVTDMIVHSKMVNGLWRIHNPDFIATETRSNDVVLGGPIPAPEGFVCISMYVSMCRSCKIKLSLANQREIINDMTYETKDAGWKQIKFITENVSNSVAMQLLVSTISENPTHFWQIDKIRFCRQEEFRKIALSENATCQLMSGTDDIITVGKQRAISENTCPEDTIGPFCIQCNLIFYDCDGITICSNDQCVCSAGYHDEDCAFACVRDSYGHGCRKRCGKCHNICNYIDGTCSSCTNNYSGPKCDIPPSIIFAKPPKVTDITYDGATISVSDFEIANQIFGVNPHSYRIEYKKAENPNSIWIPYNRTVTFHEQQQFRINNLNSQTQYLVRSVILTVSRQWQTGNHLKYTEFTTTCQEITDANIHIKAYNTSVFIALVQTTDIMCKEYTMSLVEIQLEGSTNSSGTYFVGLDPLTEYTLKIQRSSQIHEKKFMTTEGVPNKINGFAVIALTSSSIGLNWTAPKLNGNFKHYTVEYQHISYEACGSKSSPQSMKSSKTTTETVVTLTDLKPYSNYKISISASNTKFDGEPYTQQISTPAADTIDVEEIPKIFNITTYQYNANVELIEVNCENVHGPLTVKYTTTCTNEWCISEGRKPRSDNSSLPTATIAVTNLTPFSNYDIELKFCRENGPCVSPQKESFQTKPAAPNEVMNLLIYTKNETSISLRWQPPAPPTGKLKDYRIIYGYHYRRNYQRLEVTVEPTSCKIWSEFYCQTLSDLEKNAQHTIQVSARNEDPGDFGPPRLVTTTTKIEKSTAPYDLKANWTLQNRLELEWKHPNETNGDVQYFGVTVFGLTEGNIINEKFKITSNLYNLTYFYQVNASEFTPTEQYVVTIFAFNGKRGMDVSITTISPPDIPTLANDTEIEHSNETIQVTVSLNELRGRTDSYRLIVLRSKLDTENVESSQELKDYDLENFRLVFNCTLPKTFRDRHKIFIVGSNQKISGCDNIENPPLRPATEYNITVILINTHGNYRREQIYSYSHRTIGELPVSDSSLFALLALLLLIPIVAFLYVKRNDFTSLKHNFFKQNINSSTEVLEVQDDQIPLSNVPNADNSIQVSKKPKVQPRTSMGPKVHSKPIKITEFEEYVKESIKNGELERQHALFPRGQTKPWTYGSMKENKSKNRYNNLVAYDHSRVVLQKVDGNPHSDYINANYLDGYKVRRAYIATQGPKVATLDDFWRMVWQENIKYIANLANIYEGGKKKVEKYWPDINETLKFGDITIQYVSHSVFADYEHRTFILTHTEGCRKIEQLHFTSWPDHGVPLYSQSLVPFLQKILQIPLSSKAPILVHCSAGVGRTGTILLCDICLRMAAREGTIDVLRHLQLLRGERPNMVDNIEQYKLAHLVVLECLVGLHTSIPCNELEASVQKLVENGSFVLQMRYLKDTQWQDQAMKSVGQAEQEAVVVREKNRFENIFPEIQGRVFISRSPPSDETSSYINAVKVDGFRCPGRFIVTQQPLPNTVGDFWRLVHEHSTAQYSVVISLNQIDPKDETCCSFWPTTAATELKPAPHITLKHLNTMSLECYDVITVHLYTDSRKEFLPVQIIAMKNWAPRSNFPEKIEDFLSFWEQTDSSARGTETIFVTCYDGVRASGLYVAMSFIIEKMKMEQVCDVCQAVRNIRHNRREFVQELEQFEFLYKAAVLYINGFESYANFN